MIVDDLEENYYALPIKILRGLKWFLNNCHSSEFLVKVDEDVVLNLPKFAAELRKWPDEYHLGGHIIKDGVPHLWNPFTKWFVPRELWSGWSVAPAYLEGPCYVIRGDVVPMILEASYKTPIYHLEDVFITGMIANERLKLKQMTFKGIVKKENLYLWYLQRYFFDLCNFTSLHTNQNYVIDNEDLHVIKSEQEIIDDSIMGGLEENHYDLPIKIIQAFK
ncbi:unnamed protein product [Allacma fusca]|uniref:Hexosyltransferase n=1 Tax=Allacma fusca TaxID=39272 RepID=A0A8J2JR97_9HEXA|nr:unnamed protein product [Allacma fusca]